MNTCLSVAGWKLNQQCVFYLPSISLCNNLRRTRAAVIFQKNTRMWAARRQYLRQKTAAVLIQRLLRGYTARLEYKQVRSQ